MRSGLLLLVLSSLAIPQAVRSESPNRHRAFGFAKAVWMVSN